MTFDPFAPATTPSKDPFARGGLFGQLPTSSITGPMGTTYGYGGRPQTINYGFGQTRTFQPSAADLAASQKAEFDRLQNIQGLQSQSLQMQSQTLDLEQKRIEAEKQRMMDTAREYVARNTGASGYLSGTPPKGVPQWMINQARNEYISSRMQSGGGFTSWSTPAFPSGSMGGA